MVLMWRRQDLHSSSRGSAATPIQSRKFSYLCRLFTEKWQSCVPEVEKGQSLTKILAFKLCVAHFNIFLLSICWSRLFFAFICFLTCPRKSLGYFWKGYLHKNKTNCGKNDILQYQPTTKSEICFDTRAGSEGANCSCPSTLRWGTTRLFHASFFVFVSVNIFFIHYFLNRPSRLSGESVC